MARGRPKKVELLEEDLIANIPLDESDSEAIESSQIAAIGNELIEIKSVEPLPKLNENAIRFFELSKIPYCKLCGVQYENKADGSPICRQKRSDCPRLNTEVKSS